MGNTSIPASIVKARRDYTIKLKLAGLSTATITKQVNDTAKEKSWLPVSKCTVEKDIAEYFRKNRILKTEDHDHLDQMREALLAQVEIGIEKLSMHIASKSIEKTLYDENGKKVIIGTWKPFELADALEKLHKMQMDYAELQNWNFGRKNVNIHFQQNNINAMFGEAESALKSVKKSVKEDFLEDLKVLRDSLKKEEEQQNIIEQ